MIDNIQIRTGDTVLHKPTGEEWLVACVQGDNISWVGWPEGTAKIADCVLIERGTDDERHKLLLSMANMSGDDHRKRYARNVLGI